MVISANLLPGWPHAWSKSNAHELGDAGYQTTENGGAGVASIWS